MEEDAAADARTKELVRPARLTRLTQQHLFLALLMPPPDAHTGPSFLFAVTRPRRGPPNHSHPPVLQLRCRHRNCLAQHRRACLACRHHFAHACLTHAAHMPHTSRTPASHTPVPDVAGRPGPRNGRRRRRSRRVPTSSTRCRHGSRHCCCRRAHRASQPAYQPIRL